MYLGDHDIVILLSPDDVNGRYNYFLCDIRGIHLPSLQSAEAWMPSAISERTFADLLLLSMTLSRNEVWFKEQMSYSLKRNFSA